MVRRAKPGDTCSACPGGQVWVVELDKHKTAQIGKRRTLSSFPKAQDVLAPFLANRPEDAPLLSPPEAHGRAGRHRQIAVQASSR